jgi:hypothetical protein
VVSNPFVSTPLVEPKQSQIVMPFNFLTNLVDKSSAYTVFQKAVMKVAMNPHLAPQLYNLYGEEKFPPIPKAASASSSKPTAPSEDPLKFSADVDAARIHAVSCFNVFSVNRTAIFEHSTKQSRKDEYYTELHIFPSYFNHSCIPNADHIAFSNVMVIRSVQAIKKGEEIFLSYMSHNETFEERKKYLNKWFEECNCQLCHYDRQGPAEAKKRKHLQDQIIGSGLSIKQMRKMVKQIDASFPNEYPSLRLEVVIVHQQLANKLEEIAQIRMDPSLLLESIQLKLTAVEAMGIVVTDKETTSLPLPSKAERKRLPIATSLIPHLELMSGMTCLSLSRCFAAIGIEWRAEKWLRAALWSQYLLFVCSLSQH